VCDRTSGDAWLRDHPPEVAFVGYFAEPAEIPVGSPIVQSLCRRFRVATGRETRSSAGEKEQRTLDT